VARAKRTEGEPHDRLTSLCAVMTDALDAQEDVEHVKAIVMLDDGERGGIQLHGYESDVDAMTDLFLHLQAIFEANGKKLMFAPLGQG
jgi:hypothetical protein